jgi:hypothetical protein
MKPISTFPTFSLATVLFASMPLFAVIDQAEAGKGITASGSRTYKVSPIVRGGVSKPPTTGTAKANPPPIVRQHGDEKSVCSAPAGLLPLSSQGLLQRGERHRSRPPQTSCLCPPSRRAQGGPSAEVVAAGPGRNRRTGTLL